MTRLRGALRRLREGVELDDGVTAAAQVSRVSEGLLRIVIHEGRNRQVRRMCAAVGHEVTRLVRTRIGPLHDADALAGVLSATLAQRGPSPDGGRGDDRRAGLYDAVMSPPAVRALRGASTCRQNTADEITEVTQELLLAMLERNEIAHDDVISVLFTTTPDLDASFPATAARGIGFGDVPLLCASEIDVPGAMPRTVRVLLHAYTERGSRRTAPRVSPQRPVPAR